MDFFTVDYDGNASLCTREEWARNPYKPVHRTEVNGATVSTIFLGVNPCRTTKGTPLLFETMIFVNSRKSLKKLDGLQWRYCGQADAVAHHEAIVKTIKHKRFNRLKLKIK